MGRHRWAQWCSCSSRVLYITALVTMSDDDQVRFEFRFQRSKAAYTMKMPRDVHEFFENLKTHSEDFMYSPSDELVVLYPTPEGKMVEIKTNDDIELLKKTKLCFDSATKEIYCGIELLIAVKKIEVENTNKQITILGQKFDQLSSRIVDLEVSINKRMEEDAHIIQKAVRSILSEHPPIEYSKKTSNAYSFKGRINSKKAVRKDLLNQQSKLNVSKPNIDSQQENINKKSSTILPGVSITNDCREVINNKISLEPEHTTDVIKNGPPLTSVNETNSKTCLKNSIELLKEQGFTDVLRNTIILIRFDHDYERALKYLKSKLIE